jgi:hypothetical protein
MHYEIRILTGRLAGKTWYYEDEADARLDLATLDADTTAELNFRRWFGGAWIKTTLETC